MTRHHREVGAPTDSLGYVCGESADHSFAKLNQDGIVVRTVKPLECEICRLPRTKRPRTPSRSGPPSASELPSGGQLGKDSAA
jgi:hypothetical protein